MRLPTNVRTRFPAICMALGLSVMLAACGRGGSDLTTPVSAADSPAASSAYGPEADYPLVVGEPYTIGDQTYTPLDTLNYDEVGYVALDGQGGNEVSISHKTLPLPSYVEITSLDTGKTVLARAARRGPMSNEHVAALSPGALAQLGIKANASIRIRRTNPPESDRSLLRMGKAAAMRMDTPKSLLAVLKRKLPAKGSVSLASKETSAFARPGTPSGARSAAAPKALAELPAKAPQKVATLPPVVQPTAKPKAPVARVAAAPRATSQGFADAFSEKRKAVTAYPLPPMSGASRAAMALPAKRNAAVARAPVTAVSPAASRAAAPPTVRITRNQTPAAARQAREPAVEGAFVVQAAAFSNKANADRAALSIDGFVQKSGKFFRVRTGPFTNRGQAEAALAKVREAGYEDARVFKAG